MDENKKYKIAQEAKLIVSGYAFVKKNDTITIVNLNKSDAHAWKMQTAGNL